VDENFRLLKTVKNVEIFLNLSRAAVRKCGPGAITISQAPYTDNCAESLSPSKLL